MLSMVKQMGVIVAMTVQLLYFLYSHVIIYMFFNIFRVL